MMLRDHFSRCKDLPPEVKKRYLSLKDDLNHGSSGSKNFWVASAGDLGLIDTPYGLKFKKEIIFDEKIFF